MAGVTVRPRTDADLAACVDALRATHEANGYPAVWQRDPRRWLTSGHADTAAWVATVDGAVVGHVAVIASADSATDEPPALEVVRLFVDPAAQQRGAGVALMEAAVAYARAHALRPVLEVADSGGAAMRLYERLGWRRVRSWRADWAEADGRHPTIFGYVMDAP